MACSSNPCANGGACVEIGSSFLCQCSVGFTGAQCMQSLVCASSPCHNSGTCVPAPGASFTCTCPLGFVGTTCQEQRSCASSPCANGGTCVDGNGGASFACVCAIANTGSLCEQEVPCASSPCLNGGTCIASGNGGFVCGCAAQFTGSTCGSRVAFDGVTVRPYLLNVLNVDGTATSSGAVDVFGGSSGVTFTGSSRVVVSAENMPVLPYTDGFAFGGWVKQVNTNAWLAIKANSGSTVRYWGAFLISNSRISFESTPVGGSKKATVLSYASQGVALNDGAWHHVAITYRASTTQLVLAIDGVVADTQFVSDGIDSGPSTLGLFIGQRPPGAFGFQGTMSDFVFTKDVAQSACSVADRVCQNGGTCVGGGAAHQGFTCVCLLGFSGVFCESGSLSPCASIPCANGGTCTATGTSSFTCACLETYTGATCETGISSIVNVIEIVAAHPDYLSGHMYVLSDTTAAPVTGMQLLSNDSGLARADIPDAVLPSLGSGNTVYVGTWFRHADQSAGWLILRADATDVRYFGVLSDPVSQRIGFFYNPGTGDAFSSVLVVANVGDLNWHHVGVSFADRPARLVVSVDGAVLLDTAIDVHRGSDSLGVMLGERLPQGTQTFVGSLSHTVYGPVVAGADDACTLAGHPCVAQQQTCVPNGIFSFECV